MKRELKSFLFPSEICVGLRVGQLLRNPDGGHALGRITKLTQKPGGAWTRVEINPGDKGDIR